MGNVEGLGSEKLRSSSLENEVVLAPEIDLEERDQFGRETLFGMEWR